MQGKRRKNAAGHHYKNQFTERMTSEFLTPFPAGTVQVLLDQRKIERAGVLNPMKSPFSRLLAQFEPASPGFTALDLGSGSGIQSLALSLKGASSVVGVDISPKCIDVASHHMSLNALPGSVSFITADLFDPSFTKCVTPKGKYDLVISNPPTMPPSASPPLWALSGLQRQGGSSSNARSFLDMMIHSVSKLLKDRGIFVFVQSSLVDLDLSLFHLFNNGFKTCVIQVIKNELIYDNNRDWIWERVRSGGQARVFESENNTHFELLYLIKAQRRIKP